MQDSVFHGPSIGESPAADDFHELLQVSVPLMLSAGTLSVMNVADRAMLTGWSHDALAAGAGAPGCPTCVPDLPVRPLPVPAPAGRIFHEE